MIPSPMRIPVTRGEPSAGALIGVRTPMGSSSSSMKPSPSLIRRQASLTAIMAMVSTCSDAPIFSDSSYSRFNSRYMSNASPAKLRLSIHHVGENGGDDACARIAANLSNHFPIQDERVLLVRVAAIAGEPEP